MLTRRRFLVGASAVAAAACRAGPPPSPTGPNVVLIVFDQLRACALSAHGETNIATPHIDRLLDGVRCDAAIAANPLCGPARASLFTGMYPGHVGVPNNDRPLDRAAPTLASVFRSAGYLCGYVGKWHLGGRVAHIPHLHGFEDAFLGYNERYAYRESEYYVDGARRPQRPSPPDLFEPTYQTTQALELMERWRDRRFLLTVSYVPPHPPPLWREPWDAHFPEAFPYGVDPEALVLRPNVPPDAERPSKKAPGARAFLRNYYGAILSMEPEIQRLTEGIDGLGLSGDTLVVLTSDHGELAGSHGRYLKQKPYDESVRVPLGFRWPGTLASRTLVKPVSHVDVLPTVAGLAGVPVSAPVHGRDLSHAVRTGEEPGDPVLTGCHLTNVKSRWWQVREGTHSLTVYDGGQPSTLRDLAADPHELVDLATDPAHADRMRALGELLAARRAALGV